MIKTPTILVLGAGASMPYGFPSGATLRSEICMAKSAGARLNQDLVRHFDLYAHNISDFANDFELSGNASIDSFLARRADYADIGKYAIASLLCPLEKPQALRLPYVGEDDWYFYLWNTLLSDVYSLEELKNNQLKIITFNYDRSLESYLHTAIKHTFRVSDDDAQNALSFLPILHVYGSLGDFGVQVGNQTRPYSEKINARLLHVAAEGIKVIPDVRNDDPVFKKTREWFELAERVCFLGFGFDELNVKRLGIKETILSSKISTGTSPRVVVASGYSRTRAEMEIAKGLVCGVPSESLGASVSEPLWFMEDAKSLQTLRNFAWLLR